ncbi:DUF4190 domain-containing protein [Streptomyces sp. NPDC088760]|uniref:DUF4190 domain-containing protein n=1 Tax=Streptomyces sp. NPDC088760 TaxID=3365890 RepID=UPI0038252EBE
MSDEARQPISDQQPTDPRQQPPRLSLAKEQEPTGAGKGAPGAETGRAVPAADRAAVQDAVPGSSSGSGHQAAVHDAVPGPGPVHGQRQAAVPALGSGPGQDQAAVNDAVPASSPAHGQHQAPVLGSVHGAVPGSSFTHGQDQAAVRDAAPGSSPVHGQHQAAVPAPGSVHDQQTLTSLPAAAPADAGRAAWASPAGGFAPPAPGPAAPQPNPFAPPANPFHPHAGTEPVPPPPIAPDGPGQVPYGYPGTTPAYGYPGPQQTPYAPYPAGTGYAWPGMQPPPSNGMGTASLVLGIISAVGFIMWPVALVLGILALIFGGIGRGKARRGEATNPGVALAGIICGAAGIVLVLGLFALVIAVDG